MKSGPMNCMRNWADSRERFWKEASDLSGDVRAGLRRRKSDSMMAYAA